MIANLIWLTCALGACSDAGLEPLPEPTPFRDDKLAITGDFCTVPPESRVFPLRVLFVVDASDSMNVTDPPDPVTLETGRERAVRETWERLLRDQPEGVRIGILRFSAEAQGRTGMDTDGDALPDTYFTADQDLLRAGTKALGVTDRTTNYLAALNEASFEMRAELLTAEQDSLPLSKYVVVFVSDGIPDAETGEERANARENIIETVVELRELAEQFRVGSFELHTAYLSSGNGPAQDQPAQDLLMQMAEAGGGSFRSFPSGESLNFLFVDFTVIRRIFTLKGLSVVNTNAVVDDDQSALFAPPEVLGVDDEPQDGFLTRFFDKAAAGGLPDAGVPDAGPFLDRFFTDAEEGSLPPAHDGPDPRLMVDLDGDGYPACGEPLVDTDTDGLSDLLEQLAGTDPLLDDSDDDGLGDRIEWRTDGLDPMDPDDARCFIPPPCIDDDGDFYCDCITDLDTDGVCDCEVDPDLACADDFGHDCTDEDMDGYCDCLDLDRDGRCDYDDRDSDGLNDCEEVLFGTSQLGIDSDADGIPDWIEARMESNPTDEDRMDDGDLDHTITGIEVLSNTDPWCDESSLRSRTAYRYLIDDLGLSDGQSCYDFSVRNITLVPTAENPRDVYPGNGWNRVLVYIGEVSFDDPDAYAAYRIACVMAAYEVDGNLKSPPSGRVQLQDEDFHEASTFDPDRHCIWP